jgi:hypothetical protein
VKLTEAKVCEFICGDCDRSWLAIVPAKDQRSQCHGCGVVYWAHDGALDGRPSRRVAP